MGHNDTCFTDRPATRYGLLPRLLVQFLKSGWQDSNLQPHDSRSRILPIELQPDFRNYFFFLVRSSGYAPDSSVLQTDVMTTSTNSALAGTPRIELRAIGSKPIVLPLHHIPIWCAQWDSNPQPSD